MNKKMRWITLVLAAAMSATVFAGCNHDRGDEIDATKTQLYVSVVDVGPGVEWFYAIADRFEEAYADEHFEEGKTGVEIIPTEYLGYITEDMLTAGDQDVFINYEAYNLHSWIAKGLVEPLSDIMDTNLPGETKTLRSKMPDGSEDYYSYNGDVYALPEFYYPYGISYDVQLFEDNNFYFKNDGTFDDASFVTSKTDVRSCGPDGELCQICAENNYNYAEHIGCDDGLPATYAEFFLLCDQMVNGDNPVVPFTWNGTNHDYYLNFFLESVHADAAGGEEMSNFYDFNAEDVYLVDYIDDNGNPVMETEPIDINNRNGYEQFRTAGLYYAVEFLEGILTNTDYYDYNKQFGTFSNLEAQTEFLRSRYESSMTPIAMIIEGSYWETEIADYGLYDRLESSYGETAGRDQRRIGWMPLPKPRAEMVTDEGMAHTILDQTYGVMLIPSSIEEQKLPLAKLFLQFAFTDESLVESSQITSLARSAKYDFTEEDYESMSYFGESVLRFQFDDRTQVVFAYSDNPIFANGMQQLNGQFRWRTEVVNTDGTTTTFFNMSNDLQAGVYDAEEIFEGFYRYRSTRWENSYADYLDWTPTVSTVS